MKHIDHEMIESFLVPSLRQARSYKIDTPKVHTKLDQNETPYDWPDHLKEQVLKKLRAAQWNRYPSPFAPELTALVAEYAGVPPECVLTGPGTNHLITLFISALTRQLAGKVIISQPSFPLYESHCQYEGVPYEIWPFAKNFSFDLSLMPSVPDNSLILFASPNNPTGSILQKKDLETILANHPTSFVIADEAYFEFAPFRYTDLLARYNNLIILRTCSKTLGAAGIRLGYAIAGQELITEIAKLRLPYLLNHFTIAACEVFFKSDELQKRVGEHVDATVSAREQLIADLRTIGGSKLTAFDSSANFVLMRLPDQSACDKYYQGLIDHGILVRNVSKGPCLEACLRVTVGLPDENQKFLQATSNILKSL